MTSWNAPRSPRVRPPHFRFVRSWPFVRRVRTVAPCVALIAQWVKR